MNQSARIYENHMCVLQHECKNDLCSNEYYLSSGENDTWLVWGLIIAKIYIHSQCENCSTSIVVMIAESTSPKVGYIWC